jgi:hypothetical protein
MTIANDDRSRSGDRAKTLETAMEEHYAREGAGSPPRDLARWHVPNEGMDAELAARRAHPEAFGEMGLELAFYSEAKAAHEAAEETK